MFGAGPVPFGLHVKCGALSRFGQLAKVKPHTKSTIDSKPSVSEFVHYCCAASMRKPLVGDIDACEVFSGCGSVTAALQAI